MSCTTCGGSGVLMGHNDAGACPACQVPLTLGRSRTPLPSPELGGLIQLNAEQEQAVKDWAADDRLWTTQETVEVNLRTFARVILKQGLMQ